MTDPMDRNERVRRSRRAAPFTVFGDIRVLGSLLMTAPDGTHHVVTLANDGTLAAVPDDTMPPPPAPPQEPLSIVSVTAQSANAYGQNTITITGTGFTDAAIGRVRLKEHGGTYVAGAVGDGTTPYGRTVVDSHTITTVVQSADYDGTFDMVMDVGLLDTSAGNVALATPLVELASGYTFPSA